MKNDKSESKILMKNIINAIGMKKLYTLLITTLCLGWIQGQTFTVTSTGTGTGTTGTFDWAMSQALGTAAGSTVDVNFNIPGTGPFTITNSQYLNGFGNRTIRINGSSQPGYTPATPQIAIVFGNYRLFELDGGTNHLINGLIIQGPTNGIIIKSGSGHKVTGCWFGLATNGTIASGTEIKEIGIFFDNSSATNVTIGGTTDAERNVIANCQKVGIRVNNTGNNLNISGNYVGTDPTGTLARGNGTNDPLNNHGILVENGNVTTFNISNNVLSGNVGGGIKLSNAKNVSLIGNKIGTDVSGTKAVGNKSFGVFMEGGSGFVIQNNIISGNGSATFPHAPNYGTCASDRNGKPGYLDYYNSVGLYINGVSGAQIKGNKIGTDITGTKVTDALDHDLGNFYAGIKMENNSSNIVIGGTNLADRNIIGGNGFRSDAAASRVQAATCDPDYAAGKGSKGHGILLRTNSSAGNSIQNNFIGVGADNISKLGNRFSGIEVQGNSNTTISNNVLGDNAWAIFFQSNFYNANSIGNKVYGNKVGTDSTGTVAMGNGVRAFDTNDGGGIALQHESHQNIIGGSGIGQANIVCANYIGININGGAPDAPAPAFAARAAYDNTISSNLIGVNSSGNVALPNQTYGIKISEGANANTITLNTVSGNTLDGISLVNADNNTFTQNKIGVGLDGATVLPNGGNGILLDTDSDNNKIGSATAGSGNIIANHPKNGIEIVDAASTGNAIRNNSISCNTLRGIELNGKGNANYAKPTFTGAETAITVTGSANSWIEIYALDGCNDCGATPTSNKLQGKTLLKAGASPLAFAGTAGVKYTATATSAGTATVAGGNTSEFTDCYTLCTPPNTTNPVVSAVASPICLGNAGGVTVTNTEKDVTYQASINSTAVGTAVVSTLAGSTITLNIPASALPAAGTYTINVTAKTLPVCSSVTLADTATIKVNAAPVQKTATGSVICSDGITGTVTIADPETGVTYTAYKGATLLAGQSYSSGVITVPIGALTNPGDNVITVHGVIGGCTDVIMTDTANIKVNKLPSKTQTATGSVVCSDATNGTVTISSSEANVVYVAFKGSVQLVGQSYSAGVITVPVSSLTNPGDNIINVHAKIPGCAEVILDDTANIKVNKLPVPTTVTGSVICINANSGTVTVTSPESNVTYVAYIGTTKLAGQSYSAGVITIPMTSLVNKPGDNSITVHATIPGCTDVIMNAPAVIKVNAEPLINLAVTADPDTICQNGTTSITIKNTQTTVEYELFDGLTSLGKKTGTGTDLVFTPIVLTTKGLHIFTVKASIEGCTVKDLTQKPTVQVNPGPKVNLNVTYTTPLCFDKNPAVITIDSTEQDVVYDITENGTKLNTTSIIGNGANQSFSINLAVGTHNLIITATTGGCGTVQLDKKPVIVVNPVEDKAKQATVVSPICENNTTVVTVKGSTLNMEYEVFNGTTSVGKKTGTGTDLDITTSTFTAGDYILTINASIPGCSTVTLDAKLPLKVNPSPKLDLTVEYTSTNCDNVPNTITIKAAQDSVVYSLFKLGGAQEGASQTGKGADIVFNLGVLAASDVPYQYEIKASIGGCTTVTLDNKPSITINKKPDASAIKISANDTIACVGQTFTFSVQPTKKAIYSYQILDSNKIALGAAQTGNEGIRTFGPFTLAVGNHPITVIESVTGCVSDTSDALVVTVQPQVNVNDPIIKVSADTSCTDTSVTVTISKTQKDVEYTLFASYNKGALVKLASKTSNGIDDLLFGPFGNLKAGSYIFSAKAKNSGCDSIAILSTDTLLVNPQPDPLISVANNSPICVDGTNNFVELKISDNNTSVTYTYDVYRVKSATDSLIGSTSNDVFRHGPYTKAGKDTLALIAKIAGCKPVRLTEVEAIVINKLPNLNLVSDTVSVCYPSDAIVPLYGADSTWKYFATVGSFSTASQKGKDTLDFAITSGMKTGFNKVDFFVNGTGTGCATTQVGVGGIYAIDSIYALSGDGVICRDSSAVYSLPSNIAGVSGFEFSVVPDTIKFTKLSNYSIKVKWTSKADTAFVIAKPIVTGGVCDKYSDTLMVRLFDSYNKGAGFVYRDSVVCVGTIDTISIRNLKGGIAHYVVDSTIYKGKIVKKYEQDKYIVQYNTVGTVYHKYIIESPCTGKDSIMLKITVLPYPEVNAGNYPVLDMKYYPREVVLDGSSSSKGKFTYKWTMNPPTNINNSNSIMASFVPEQTKQVAYLTVANEYMGMCPVTDSAAIVIDLGIFIPNVFTPNNDGDHDTWELQNINAFYPNVSVDVYSKWGTLVFSSSGYPSAWDGSRNGKEVPAATYYYVIDLKKPGFKPVAGSVTIIR